jgi:histone deacetylase 1/2
MRNVSRAWAFETGLAAGYELGSGASPVFLWILGAEKFHLRADLPVNEYYEYFGPDYKLDVRSSNMEDRNSVEYLERIKNVVMEHLREIGGPPGIQMTGMCSVPVPGTYLKGSNRNTQAPP